MINIDSTPSSSAQILDRVDDFDAVINAWLDQGKCCARCGKADLFPQQAHGWAITDANGDAVIKVLCGHCARNDRARPFMSVEAARQSRAKTMDRADQVLGLANVFTGSRRSRRDEEYAEPTRSTNTASDELPPGGLDVSRPNLGYITRVR
jgi:hypothetical protein